MSCFIFCHKTYRSNIRDNSVCLPFKY